MVDLGWVRLLQKQRERPAWMGGPFSCFWEEVRL